MKDPLDEAYLAGRRGALQRNEMINTLLRRLAMAGLQSQQYRNCADFRETVDEALALVPAPAGTLVWDEGYRDYV